MRSIREIIESALRYLGAIVSPESGAEINLRPANIHNRDRAAEELRRALKLLPAHPWPATADDPDEIQSGKYDEPAPAPSLPATEGEEALRTYGSHLVGCALMASCESPCTCGFEQALAALRSKGKP